MIVELLTICNFDEVWETKAKGRDDISSSEQPAQKVGHLRADHDRYKWWPNYFPCNEHLKTPEVKSEMESVCAYLINDLFEGKDGLNKLFTFCDNHPAAEVKPDSNEYNFYVNGEYANFWVRLNKRHKDYNLYVHTFTKAQIKD